MSITKDVFFVIGKILIGIVFSSFFMYVNALYSAGMGVARSMALRMDGKSRRRQITIYRRIGMILSGAGLCYALYSVRLFLGGITGVYSMNTALIIALYTFIEFGINIRGAIRLRKSRSLRAKALRAISFSATLLCFALTQTAILSFAAEGDNNFYNALSGMAFGVLAAIRGIFVILDSRRQDR